MSANAIQSITIKGFKSFDSMSVELRPINLIIGANGSGKSNFIGAFTFLRDCDRGRLRDYVLAAGGAEKILHFGSRTTSQMFFRVELEPGQPLSKFGLMIRPTQDDSLFAHDEWAQADGRAGNLHWAGGGSLEYWQPFHLHDTSCMRKTAALHDNHFLRSDGSNLPAVLYYLREKQSDAYSLLVGTVRQVAPFFDDFRLSPLELNSDAIQLEWQHRNSDQYFNASSLSDGTLRFIAVATVFLDPRRQRRSLILIDEPELGLHPRAIELLAALIRQASVDTQVVVSTQSSGLLDHFAPEDVLVAERVDGGTQLKRLDSARLATWLEDYSLGQLWEKNEFGGLPSLV